MIKGVGPQRAELLASRGIHTSKTCSPIFRFATKTAFIFSNIKDIQPNGVYTIRVQVMSGQAVRSMRRHDAVFHLLVRDATGQLPCKFFHGGYLEGRLKPGQSLILHGKAEVDKLRPARIEMVNPQMELTGDQMDSTEVGRIVPIYEAIGTFGSRAIRRAIYAALELIDPSLPDILPAPLRARLGYPTRREALIHTHFPPSGESLDALNTSARLLNSAHLRRIFSLSTQSRPRPQNHAQRKRHRLSPSRKQHPRKPSNASCPSSPLPHKNASSPKLPPTSKNPRP